MGGSSVNEWEDITDQSPDSGEWEDITDEKGAESSFPAGVTLRNLVRVESGGDYAAISGGGYNDDIKYNTVAENMKRYGNKALGMYQIQGQTAAGVLRKRGIDPSKYVFDEKGQERLFDYLLADRGYGKWLDGKISDRQFAANISKEWAALPHPDTGRSYYSGVGNNKHLVSTDDVMNALKNERAYQQGTASGQRISSRAGTGEVRRGMSDEELMLSLGYDPSVIKKSRYYKPGEFSSQVDDPNSPVTKFLSSKGPGQTVAGLAEGLLLGPAAAGANLYMRGLQSVGLADNPDVMHHRFRNDLARQSYEQVIRGLSPGQQSFDPAELVGSMLIPTGRINGPVSAARAGATIGLASNPLSGNTTPEEDLMKTGTNIGAGATGGLLGDVFTRRVLVPGMTKLANYFRKAPIQGAEGSLVSASQQYGVPLTYGDISGKPIATKAETMLESMPGPLGIGGFRAKQQNAVQTAVGAYSEGLFKKMVGTKWAGLVAVQREAAKGNKVAQSLLNEINNAGDDWHSIISASGNLNLFLKKLKADYLFNKAATLAEEKGAVVVPKKTTQTIQQAIKELEGSISPDKQRTIDILNTVLERIGSRPVGYVGPTGSIGAGISFQDANRLRSELGEMVRSAFKGDNTLMGTFGASNMSKVRAAITQDMDASALQSSVPGLSEMYTRANRYYLKEIVPYKNSILAKALDNPNVDEVFPKLFKGVKHNRAASNLSALDPKGREAARYAFVAEAISSSYNSNSGIFSPAKFATAMNGPKASQVRSALFSGADGKQLVGFVKLIKHAERAGQYMENPPTGNRLVPYLVGGGLAAGAANMNPPALMGTILSDIVLKGLFTTTEGKRLLLAASNMSSGSPGMQKIMQQIINIAPKLGGKAISQENQNQ